MAANSFLNHRDIGRFAFRYLARSCTDAFGQSQHQRAALFVFGFLPLMMALVGIHAQKFQHAAQLWGVEFSLRVQSSHCVGTMI